MTEKSAKLLTMLKTAFCDCLGRDTYKTDKKTLSIFSRVELIMANTLIKMSFIIPIN